MLKCEECGCKSESGKGWFGRIAEDPEDGEGAGRLHLLSAVRRARPRRPHARDALRLTVRLTAAVRRRIAGHRLASARAKRSGENQPIAALIPTPRAITRYVASIDVTCASAPPTAAPNGIPPQAIIRAETLTLLWR